MVNEPLFELFRAAFAVVKLCIWVDPRVPETCAECDIPKNPVVSIRILPLTAIVHGNYRDSIADKLPHFNVAMTNLLQHLYFHWPASWRRKMGNLILRPLHASLVRGQELHALCSHPPPGRAIKWTWTMPAVELEGDAWIQPEPAA
eukprot:s1675_g1.t1